LKKLSVVRNYPADSIFFLRGRFREKSIFSIDLTMNETKKTPPFRIVFEFKSAFAVEIDSRKPTTFSQLNYEVF